MAKRIPLAERLWRRVNKNGPTIRSDLGPCWLWMGGGDRDGYGSIGRGTRADGADRTHRVAWELTHGPIPAGLCVLHRCDNPPCCNPDHLFLGTRADNQHDMAAKGRAPGGSVFGEGHPRAKLHIEDVVAIRALAAQGETHRVIAARFGVAYSLITRIVRRDAWRSVP